MISDLKPYPAMKESGVPWLGQVPEHWELPRLGTLLRERGETNADGRVTDVLSVMRNRGVIPYSEKGNVGNKKSEDITRYKIVRPNDIVVNCMNVIIGSVGLSRYIGCLSPVYYVLTKRSASDDPRYLNNYFQTKPFQESLVRIGNGILAHRMRIPMELLKRELFPRPPLEEQTAIVRFLDHVDRRIRRYISAKQKLIKLLEEQKQAMIHRAVTRGLDPNVGLKPSGVEWLGDVPEHWEVVRLGRISTVFNGTTPSRMQPAYWQNGAVPWLSSAKVNEYIVETASELVTERALKECSISIVPKGAVIIGLVGQGKTRGMAALLGIDACINQNLAAIIPRGGLSSCYLHSFLTAFYKSLREFGRGGNQEALNCEIVGGFRIPIPPLNEQRVLCEYLGAMIQGSQPAEQRIRNEIELIREYRTRLITDVVTGKVDVRTVAARLPVEAEEPEPVDDAEANNDIDADAADELDAIAEEVEA